MRVTWNVWDDRAGSRGYAQFDKYTNSHAHTHIQERSRVKYYALSFRARHHLCRQEVARAGSQQPLA